MKRVPGFYVLVFFWLGISMACSILSPRPVQPPPDQGTGSTPVPLLPLPDIKGRIAYASQRGTTWQIIAVNPDGSGETSLTSPDENYSRPAWSPDGNRIAMRLDNSGGLGIAIMDVRHEGGELIGSAPIAVVNGFADGPSWSPDGKRLLYFATQNNSGWLTFILDISTGQSTQLAAIPENSNDTAWSPDGSRIVFATYTQDVNQVRDLYLINADGTGLTQLTSTPAINEDLPAWSPDGSRIAFAAVGREPGSQQQPGSDIYTINADGTGLKQITTDPRDDFDPVWSPDGKYLAFVSERHNNNDSNYEIYMIGADGTGEMRLTNNHYTDRWPSWRAELPQDADQASCQSAISLLGDVTIQPGTRMAGAQDFTKVWRVKNTGTCAWTPAAYALRFTQGESLGSQLLTMPGAVQPGSVVDLAVPLSAPDSPGVHQGYWQLFDGSGNAVPAEDGTRVSLAVEIDVTQPGEAYLPYPLYFIPKEDTTYQLWRLETDGRTRVQITHEPQPILSFSMASDGRLAYYTNGQVIVSDADGASPSVVASMEVEDRPSAVVWSPDGKQLAYAMGGVKIHDLATGSDRLLITDNDTKLPGLEVYAPYAWSPDGSKLIVRAHFWEGAGLKVVSASDGNVLAELPFHTATWSRDSQSVYHASAAGGEWMPGQPGLWRASATGQGEQELAPGAYAWWPVQAPDGSLRFFMDPQVSTPGLPADHAAQLYAADAGGANRTTLNTPYWITPNDTFNVRWSPYADNYIVQLERPALDANEVLLVSLGGTPPVFLMQEIGIFEWGR